MKSREIRQTFVDYFKKHGHTPVASSSIIPENDATLLFANAGMNQFKNLFLGLENRDYKRAVTVQKCVRAGGKHNDLENVGHTARHHTFFEMLGNFSFGDYFKKDSIHFAWDLLTKELQLPKERLYVTVFTDDDEAADIWHKQEGVPRDHIYRFGEKDNFWRMGDVGPCGPCSEIFYDHGPEADLDPTKPSKMGGDGDRYVEIWNNVFMQFNEDESGRHPLPKPSVDTGGGLERWTAALQGKPNNYDTDIFQPIIQKAAEVSKKEYVSHIQKLSKHPEIQEYVSAMRVMADHARATAFLISDGVLPSNEGRGYVLRRIMRRAIRYGRKLTDDPSLLAQCIQVVIEEMSHFYPELKRQKQVILSNVNDEVARFLTTLDQGTEILEEALQKLGNRGHKIVDGTLVFKLYDTFGFPVDLTRLMAQEKGFTVDEASFEKNMQEARNKAKASWKGKALTADAAHLVQLGQLAKPSRFTGYNSTQSSAKLQVLSNGREVCTELKAGEQGILIFEQTPFYAESGGQVGDQGLVTSLKGARAEVLDCTKQNNIHLHHVRVIEGRFTQNETCTLQVTDSSRRATEANHSATHLLHAALRKLLGAHVTQAGSLVDSERLRFDYTHNKPLSNEEILQIEELVNAEISRAAEVAVNEMAHQQALEAGAMALFGEKYGDQVRVVKMGEFSTELCGGTHVSNTAMIRLFKIVSESGVSSGVRRIEGITGDNAVQYLLKNTRENLSARNAAGYHESWAQYLHPESSTSVVNWIEQSRSMIKTLEKEIQTLKGATIDVDLLVKNARDFTANGSKGKLVTAFIEIDDRKALSDISDRIKDKLQSGIVLLVGKGESTHPMVLTVSKDLTKSLNAGKLLSEVAIELKGKGGGRPDFAQGAADDLSGLDRAFKKAAALVGIH